jgi:hypothetical protein
MILTNAGRTALLLLSASSLLCVLWIQITTAELLVMATNNDHEMTAAGTASPRDEDMRGDGAEPTI